MRECGGICISVEGAVCNRFGSSARPNLVDTGDRAVGHSRLERSSHAAGERMTKGRFIITECDESLSLSEDQFEGTRTMCLKPCIIHGLP